MCMSCGCKQFDENHGDDRNLTMKDFKDAAEAARTDVQQVARNIEESFGGFAGQSDQYSGAGTGRQNR